MPVVRYIELKSFLYVVAFPKDMHDKFISKAVVQELKQCHLTTLKIICDFRNNFTRFRTNFCQDQVIVWNLNLGTALKKGTPLKKWPEYFLFEINGCLSTFF